MTNNKDLEMVRNPDKWPNWPLLPVKSKREMDETGFPKLGVILAGQLTDVLLANMFGPINEATPVVSYKTIEELVKDWTVD